MWLSLPVQTVANIQTPISSIQTRGFKQKAKGGRNQGDAEALSARDKRAAEDINRFIELTEAAKSYKHPWTEEELKEHEEISKEYTRQSQIRNNQ